MDWFRRLVHLPPAGNEMANQVDMLHLLVLFVTVLGSGVTLLVAGYFLIKYRARAPRRATRRVVAPRWLEVSLAGALVTLFVVWWVLGFRQYLQLKHVGGEAYEVHVVAKQWMWKFSEPDGNTSIGVLIVPRNRPVRLTITSRDVVHSMFVPPLRLKADAVPGRYTTLPFRAPQAASWPIYCAEYCGLSHSRMLGRVVVLSDDDFARYRAGKPVKPVERARNSLEKSGIRLRNVANEEGEVTAATGQRLAQRFGCLVCHDDGRDESPSPPKIGPTWTHLYGTLRKSESGEMRIADSQYLSESIRDPQSHVVAGFPPTMPTYQGQLRAAQEASIIAYIRSLAPEAAPLEVD